MHESNLRNSRKASEGVYGSGPLYNRTLHHFSSSLPSILRTPIPNLPALSYFSSFCLDEPFIGMHAARVIPSCGISSEARRRYASSYASIICGRVVRRVIPTIAGEEGNFDPLRKSAADGGRAFSVVSVCARRVMRRAHGRSRGVQRCERRAVIALCNFTRCLGARNAEAKRV